MSFDFWSGICHVHRRNMTPLVEKRSVYLRQHFILLSLSFYSALHPFWPEILTMTKRGTIFLVEVVVCWKMSEI